MKGASADLHGGESRRSRLTRRMISIPAVIALAAGLTLLLPLWLPIAVAADLIKLKPRLPLTRLLLFGLCWAWIEIAGLARSLGAWVTGRAGDRDLHYELMSWWTNALMNALRATTGLQVVVEGEGAVEKGDAVVLSRHASLADSLVTAWVFCSHSGLEPRYVLKRELLADPCLDVVGHRVPNVFIDRTASDGGPELAKISALATDLGSEAVCVIFPEGTRVSDAKRERALAKISERDAQRAERMAALTHLLPPRHRKPRHLSHRGVEIGTQRIHLWNAVQRGVGVAIGEVGRAVIRVYDAAGAGVRCHDPRAARVRERVQHRHHVR